MPGPNRVVKRAWSLAQSSLTEDAREGNVIEDPMKAMYETINDLVADVAMLTQKNEIVPGSAAAGLQSDGTNAENIETQTAVLVYYEGRLVTISVDAEIDTSVGVTASSTVNTSALGALWVYADAEAEATCTVEASHPGAASAESTAVAALRWLPADHFQRNVGEIPIGVVYLTEGGSGAFTWGTDSIAAETETFVDFRGRPGVITDGGIADVIVTAGAAATWAHGAGGVVLGSGAFVALTAQTALPINNGTAIVDGNSGGIALYVLSDGGAEGLQRTSADADHGAALDLLRVDNHNPYLACIGYIVVDNASGSDFTPGTTNWNTSGVTSTVYTLGRMGELYASTLTTPESQD